MTLCHYSEILQIAANLAGLDYSYDVGSSGLSSDEERGLRASLNTQLAMLWPKGKWPGITRVEQRQFRATYSAATNYAAGTFVYWPPTEGYYQAVDENGTTGNAPASSLGAVNSEFWAEAATFYDLGNWDSTILYAIGDQVTWNGVDYQSIDGSTGVEPGVAGWEDYWGILVPFDAYISYTQTGETEIWEQGEIFLWTMNPRATTRATLIPSFLSENGIQPSGNYPARPWVEFKIRVPNLTGEPWDSGDAYAVGDQVQFETSTGNVASIDFYDCVAVTTAGQSPVTHAAKWSRVELPDIFKHYLGAKCAVAWLAGEGDARFSIAEAAAAEAESNLNDLLYRVQGQIPRTQVMQAA